jgi:hypothetical protein
MLMPRPPLDHNQDGGFVERRGNCIDHENRIARIETEVMEIKASLRSLETGSMANALMLASIKTSLAWMLGIVTVVGPLIAALASHLVSLMVKHG